MVRYRLLYPGVPLYRAQENPRALLALPDSAAVPEAVTLEEAIASAQLRASFLYCDQPPDLSGEAEAQSLYQAIQDALAALDRCDRAVFWRGAETYALGLDGPAGRTGSALELPLAREWRFRVARSTQLAPAGDRLAFTDTANAFSLVPTITAGFSGGALLLGDGGVFCFELSLKYPEFLRVLNPGFEYRFPAGEEGFVSFSLLRQGGQGPGSLTLRASFDPCRPEARTLTVSALSDGRPMESCFRQVTGQPMGLLPVPVEEGETCPAGLRFCPGERRGPHPTEPMGDYVFPGGGSLLCGLLGTEAIEVPSGGRLRFVPGSPAWAPRFPARPLEIGDFVTGLPEDLLTGDTSTAWACTGQAGMLYRSQPDGAALFTGGGGLLAHDETGVSLPFPSAAFPLVPMAGLDSVPGCEAGRAAALERQILAPARQHILLSAPAPQLMGRGEAVRTAATPSGQIVELAENGAWTGLRLAQTAQDRLWLERPDGALTEAFRTGNLFLVVADPAHLGAFTGQAAPLGDSAFHNRLRLGDWEFTLPVGRESRYNDYRCVLVVKGRDGALYDPEGDGGLIAGPACWSCRESFSSPVVDGRPDPAQQTNLSNWLTGFFAASAARNDQYSASFNALARDPAWRGVLFLNVPIGKENLPEELASLTFGLPEGEGLFLHHLGLRLSTVEPGERGPVQRGESAVFGLIRYEASGYSGGAPAAGPGDGPFRTLALRVLFENSAVKCLESKAMLRLDRVLGTVPGPGSCAGRVLLFSGGGQARDGGRTCVLRCEETSQFCFPSGPLERVTVSSASLQTLDAAADRYRFELSGSMAFRVLETEDGAARDLFSFSNLPFSGLALELSPGENGGQSLSERAEGMRLDELHAEVRAGSLAENLALTLEGLRSGSEEKGPAGAGYTFLPLAGLRLSSAAAPPWHGLLCRAALGSLGELGDGAGISCKLLLAWDGGGAPSLWLSLPKLFEVERVLSLSVGDARMAYADGAYLLTLPEVCLKCLGVLKLPPSGTLSCALFGGKGASETGLGWYALYQKEKKQ